MNFGQALVIVVTICALTCHFVAKKRGLDAPFWLAMGSITGPIAVLLVCFVKPKQSSEEGSY